jgi:Amiloride-sensitive sodium channel
MNFKLSRKYLVLAKTMYCITGFFVLDVLNISECNYCLEELRKILIPIDELFEKCKFRNQVIDCSKSMLHTFVGDRSCYTFNELGITRNNMDGMNEDWSIDEGYKSTAPIDAYPPRALGVGPEYGFSILLKSDKKHSDEHCSRDDAFSVRFLTSN